MSEQVGAQYVVIGDDFRFGHGREGDLSLLQRAGKKFGYEVNSMNTVLRQRTHQRYAGSVYAGEWRFRKSHNTAW